jgi:uncharacterized protein (TIGR03083 family)
VLSAALRRRPAGFPDPQVLAPAAAAYAAQVRKLDLLLGDASAQDWATVVLGTQTTRQLVAHLSGNDAVLAAALGLTPEKAGDHTPEEPYEAWRRLAFALLRHAIAAPMAGRVVYGLPMSVRSAYVIRAYETWIHGDDIRSGTGRPASPPTGEHLHLISNQQVRSLPIALQLSGLARPGQYARFRLTGDGGGEWTVDLSPSTEDSPADDPQPHVTICADALEFCRLGANRLSLDEVPITVSGDRQLADELLSVMTFFSHE